MIIRGLKWGMFSTLFKWTKRLVFLGSVFLGLYYFGDFRVNDVNVRDYLHTVVPPEQMDAGRDKAIKFAKILYQKIRDKIRGTQAVDLMDKISDKDQKKMMELLQANLKQALDEKTLQDNAKKLEDTVKAAEGQPGSKTP